MSTNPRRIPASASTGVVPFAAYAQVARMLVPLANKVSFYDSKGNALWISDGMEGPELRRHVELLLARPDAVTVGDGSVTYTASEDSNRIYVFTIDDEDGTLLGAMGIICRDMSNATQGSSKTIARLLTPLIEILRHGWRTWAHEAKETPAVAATSEPPVREPEIELTPDDNAGGNLAPLAALRRLLAVSTQRLQCAFGAVIVTEPSFTLSHRVSREESDLAINAAIDNVRAHMLKWMNVRSEPIIVNTISAGRGEPSPYKFAVLPLKVENAVVGLMVLFRNKYDNNFTSADVESLLNAAARLPADVLAQLGPKKLPAPVKMPRVQIPAGQSASHFALQKSLALVDPRATPVAPTPPAAPRARVQPMTMDERLRNALRDDSFGLFAQRIRPLHDDRRSNRYEVLLRWRDGNQIYAPRSFFAAAEAGKLMPEVDGWVIRSLFRTLRTHAAQVRSTRSEFCINIAAQSITTPGFVEFVVAEVCKAAVPAGLLVFEVSEASAIDHQEAVATLASRLRDVGCRIALDNCRAGLNTLAPMRNWPVSCVKIDGSLIRDVLGSSRSESVVRAVADLASHRGIETVAECVESEDVCRKLMGMGIDFAQGFHIDSPQPLNQILR
jgi:EAL domain-containing protein (putative c-di-GMP-specific phosphodiesterase class I)